MLASPYCTERAFNAAHNIALAKGLAILVAIINVDFKFSLVYKGQAFIDSTLALHTKAGSVAVQLPLVAGTIVIIDQRDIDFTVYGSVNRTGCICLGRKAHSCSYSSRKK